ncbi:hypothetical protein KZJ38_18380 [Paraburkholderia edwinii]|jgi:hypothetical protein|uniref:Uncharacterized protein n=1 Tax=Paraburkholderia edwinii TaxID=2861782 RepID=A0ABX8ULJ7_9BURK|nr:hypothetical protein [Paraburkholderia edwinii]QYD68217.1 hypothetical protein KZJ38_18380 [Paraburkholderia edwinii]
MKKIKLMADYQCHPLWDMSPGSYGDIDPGTLPISAELRQMLTDWAREFDETLDMADPAKSGFKSEAAEAAFKARGTQLADQLQDELGPDFFISVKV